MASVENSVRGPVYRLGYVNLEDFLEPDNHDGGEPEEFCGPCSARRHFKPMMPPFFKKPAPKEALPDVPAVVRSKQPHEDDSDAEVKVIPKTDKKMTPEEI